MVVFDPSCLTDIRNITMYVPTQYICKIFSKRDCGILPTWYFKSVFYCLPTHPLYVIDHFFKVRYIKLGVICLPTSSYSYHMYTMCMLSTYLCTMNLSRQIHTYDGVSREFLCAILGILRLMTKQFKNISNFLMTIQKSSGYRYNITTPTIILILNQHTLSSNSHQTKSPSNRI